MSGFQICFDYPWLLLLLIPAALCTFIPYFRIKKRYRRTRNRIISVVLHSLVMVLTILLLSGFYIRYYIPNEENEIILLVDVSDTESLSQEKRDEFVGNVIDECAFENIAVGVVSIVNFEYVHGAAAVFNSLGRDGAHTQSLRRLPRLRRYAHTLCNEQPPEQLGAGMPHYNKRTTHHRQQPYSRAKMD